MLIETQLHFALFNFLMARLTNFHPRIREGFLNLKLGLGKIGKYISLINHCGPGLNETGHYFDSFHSSIEDPLIAVEKWTLS